jgi:hypothetical protein
MQPMPRICGGQSGEIALDLVQMNISVKINMVFGFSGVLTL